MLTFMFKLYMVPLNNNNNNNKNDNNYNYNNIHSKKKKYFILYTKKIQNNKKVQVKCRIWLH